MHGATSLCNIIQLKTDFAHFRMSPEPIPFTAKNKTDESTRTIFLVLGQANCKISKRLTVIFFNDYFEIPKRVSF